MYDSFYKETTNSFLEDLEKNEKLEKIEKERLAALEKANAESLRQIAANTQYISALETRLSALNTIIDKLRSSLAAETERAEKAEKSNFIHSWLALFMSFAGIIVAIIDIFVH